MEKRKKIQIMLDDLIQKKKNEVQALVKGIQNSGYNRKKLYEVYFHLLSAIKNNRESWWLAYLMD
jgi:predicted transcriptional regulator